MSKTEIEQAVSGVLEQDFDKLDTGPPFDTSQVVRGGDLRSTGRVGYIEASYSDLVKVFGEPEGVVSDKEKWADVDTQWIFTLPSDRAIDIYNYGGGPPVEGVLKWHVGGMLSYLDEIESFLRAAGFQFYW